MAAALADRMATERLVGIHVAARQRLRFTALGRDRSSCHDQHLLPDRHGARSSAGVHYVLLAWLIAAVMKTAQGSGTVSMITSSAIMAALIGPDAQLGYHPVYILLSIGFGSMAISWMNDSGFWIVSRMSGFTEREALQTWTFLLAAISVVGLLQVFLMSWLFPLV